MIISTQTGKRLQLGQLLIRRGAVTEEQLEQALEHQRRTGGALLLGEVLVKLDLCAEEQIMEALAEGCEVPFARISPRLADPRVIDILPREFLEKHCLLPLFKVRNRLALAVNEPANVFLVEEVERLTDCQVIIVCASAKDIRATLENHLPSANVFVIDEIFDEDGAGELSLVEDKIEDITDLEAFAEGSPVIKLVNYLIYHAVREGASDIHIEPDDNSLRVRYRVDGVLHEAMLPAQVQRFQAAIVSRLKILSHLDIAEKRLPQDGRIKLRVAEREVDVRVSVIPMLFGEAVVLRLLDRSATLLGLEALGMSSDDSSIYSKVLGTPHGIVLITGPTGSGKTTTLYASLARINDVDRKIITIEDPIEYHLEGINQIQVDTKTGLTFSRGLRAVLRHDPDVVLVGEIRDQETADIAVQASLTGHLVFSTLHTNDAPGAITRLIDMRVEPYLVASSLEMVVAQRLVRLICPGCRHPIQITDAHRIRRELGSDMPDALYEGRGCRECGGTGYRGRKGIFEVMAVSDEVRTLIMGRASAPVIRRTAVEQGMKSLRSDGWRLIRSGLTTVQEVLRVTKDEQADGRWKGAVGVTANDEVPTTKP